MAAEHDVRQHESDPVLWLGERDRSGALRRLVGAECPLIADPSLTAAATPQAIMDAVKAQRLVRIGAVAEAGQEALALQLALDEPEAVSALVLLAPRLIDPRGQAPSGAEEALVARLGTLRPPLLVLLGTKDALAPPDVGRHYRARLASANVIFVYDAGAAMAEERPEAVAELVIDFLRRRDLFLVRQQSDLLYR